jgi:hypothetical protein
MPTQWTTADCKLLVIMTVVVFCCAVLLLWLFWVFHQLLPDVQQGEPAFV